MGRSGTKFGQEVMGHPDTEALDDEAVTLEQRWVGDDDGVSVTGKPLALGPSSRMILVVWIDGGVERPRVGEDRRSSHSPARYRSCLTLMSFDPLPRVAGVIPNG